MISESWNQLKENFSLMVILNICAIAIFFIANTIINVGGLRLTYVIQGMVFVIIESILLKTSLKIVLTTDKVKLKEIISKDILKNIIDILKTYIFVGIVSFFAIIIITFTAIAIGWLFYSQSSLDDTGLAGIPIGIAIITTTVLPWIICLKISFIPFVIIDESLTKLSFLKKIKLGYCANKGYWLEIISVCLKSILIIAGGLLCFGVGIVISIALIHLMFSNLYVTIRDDYLYSINK